MVNRQSSPCSNSFDRTYVGLCLMESIVRIKQSEAGVMVCQFRVVSGRLLFKRVQMGRDLAPAS